MPRSRQGIRRSVIALACVAVLGACAQSTPSRFYTLAGTEPVVASVKEGPVIALASVSLPRYLDRPQIVTRISPTQLKAAEFDRWIEPLPTLVTAALAEGLQSELASSRVVALPHKGPLPDFDYRVHVDVSRFEAGPGTEAVLAATWSIASGSDRQEIAFGNAIHRHTTGTGTYDEIVQALGAGLRDLGTEIAGALRQAPTES